MSCKQIRRELMEHIAFREELGPRSGPHLAHLETCAACREEVGIDRELVRHLRTALRERVGGRAPSAASWEHVRRRTVDAPVRPWAARVLRWGGMLPAAVAGIMIFATATAPEAQLLPGARTPVATASARQAVPPALQAGLWRPGSPVRYPEPPVVPPLPGWPMERDTGGVAPSDMPPISGRMR